MPFLLFKDLLDLFSRYHELLNSYKPFTFMMMTMICLPDRIIILQIVSKQNMNNFLRFANSSVRSSCSCASYFYSCTHQCVLIMIFTFSSFCSVFTTYIVISVAAVLTFGTSLNSLLLQTFSMFFQHLILADAFLKLFCSFCLFFGKALFFSQTHSRGTLV